MRKLREGAEETIRVIDNESYHDGSVPIGYIHAKQLLFLLDALSEQRKTMMNLAHGGCWYGPRMEIDLIDKAIEKAEEV